MAYQSLRQRFDIRSGSFLMAALCYLMPRRSRAAKSNTDTYSAHDNRYEKTAGAKIELALNLLTGLRSPSSLKAFCRVQPIILFTFYLSRVAKTLASRTGDNLTAREFFF